MSDEWDDAMAAHGAAMKAAARRAANAAGIDLERIEIEANSVDGRCDYCGKHDELREVVYTAERAGKTTRLVCVRGCAVDDAKQPPTLTESDARRLELWLANSEALVKLMADNGVRHKKRHRVEPDTRDSGPRESPCRVDIYWRGAAGDFNRGSELLLAELIVHNQAQEAAAKREIRAYEATKKAERSRLFAERARARLEVVCQTMTYKRPVFGGTRVVLTHAPMFRSLDAALDCKDARRLPLDTELARMESEGYPKKALREATLYTGKRLNLALERGKACLSAHTPDEQETSVASPVAGGQGSAPSLERGRLVTGPSPDSVLPTKTLRRAVNGGSRQNLSKELTSDDRSAIEAT